MKITSVALGNKEFDDIAGKITTSYPGACVMFIEKIEEHCLQSKYDECKNLMSDANERTLFHGTTEQNARVIAENGYDPRLNHRSAHGKGVYFAENASYSRDYTNISYHKSGFELSFMLINTVLVGKIFANGGKGDTQVDTVKNPRIFCVPLAHQAIPKYIVAFHKNAS